MSSEDLVFHTLLLLLLLIQRGDNNKLRNAKLHTNNGQILDSLLDSTINCRSKEYGTIEFLRITVPQAHKAGPFTLYYWFGFRQF